LAIINFPPALDLNYYRQNYPELNGFPDEVVMEHYRKFAVAQGHSTCIYDRREALQILLQNTIDNNHLKALEISPWDSPFLRGDDVKYFEVMDAEDLRKVTVAVKRNLVLFRKRLTLWARKATLASSTKSSILFSVRMLSNIAPTLSNISRASAKFLTRAVFI